MKAVVWHRVAAISGMAALGLGTYGAHMYKPAKPAYKDVWQTANLYHLVHTAAMLAAPVTRHPHVFGGLLTFGIISFCGTCYVTCIEDLKCASPVPFGGFSSLWIKTLLTELCLSSLLPVIVSFQFEIVSSSSSGCPIAAKKNTHKESKGVLVVVYSTEQL